MSRAAYFALLAVVGLLRLFELRHSRSNQKQMAAEGAKKVPQPHFRWMVALHAGVLAGAGLEVGLLHRPFLPALAISMGTLFLLANGLRWWVIRTLAGHWNVEVMDSTRLGVVSGGPYRWVRHPNYLAVVVELFSLPLIYTAWITAAAATAANAWVLRQRLAVEERILLADPAYREVMGAKPRFLPRLRRS